MPKIYLVSDATDVLEDVSSALEYVSQEITTFHSGTELLAACRAASPDLAVIDMQIGTMGGMAIAMDLHLEESGGRLPHVPVLLLLDRRADVFLALRSQSEGYVIKPLDPLRVAEAAAAVLRDGSYKDPSYRPAEVQN